ncbi:hypothetical protein EN813_042405 [Mesorhizobium sp. M00.F.Ca.ET.170.01.1.1]|nr:hypothetical protein EN813_042405 [Mesorhizobium sp. M00.F.Ca.ET.170.01.1.1]
MRKSDKLREVYKEIRRVVGTTVPAVDIVRLAHLILRSYQEDDADVDEYGRPADSRAFPYLPVDEAMSDGGWKVLLFELRAAADTDRLDADAAIKLNRRLENFLGPEWQSRFPPG